MTSLAPSLISDSVPAAFSESALPGTAKISFPCSTASVTKRRVPLFSGASTTTTPSESPAAMRLRSRKKCRMLTRPGGYSLMTAPVCATSRTSERRQTSCEVPSTPMQGPWESRAPLAAASSIPCVSRLSTTAPSAASRAASSPPILMP